MKKDGFTLTELLAVIAVIAILTIMVVPNVLNTYNEGVKKTMETQENNVADAADLLVSDYCTRKINSTYICPSGYDAEVNNQKYVCLSDLNNLGYIKSVTYKGSDCDGMVIFTKDSKGKFTQSKAYLYCAKQSDGTYLYTTDNSVTLKSDCKVH